MGSNPTLVIEKFLSTAQNEGGGAWQNELVKSGFFYPVQLTYVTAARTRPVRTGWTCRVEGIFY